MARTRRPLKARDDTAQRLVSWQQGRLAQQALRGLWLAHELAPQLGQELARGEVLLRGMPPQKGSRWLSCAN